MIFERMAKRVMVKNDFFLSNWNLKRTLFGKSSFCTDIILGGPTVNSNWVNYLRRWAKERMKSTSVVFNVLPCLLLSPDLIIRMLNRSNDLKSQKAF